MVRCNEDINIKEIYVHKERYWIKRRKTMLSRVKPDRDSMWWYIFTKSVTVVTIFPFSTSHIRIIVYRIFEKYIVCLLCKSVKLNIFFRIHVDQKKSQKDFYRREKKMMQLLFNENFLDYPDNCSDLTDKEYFVERNRFRNFIESKSELFGYRLW